jgi:hypothetical protein
MAINLNLANMQFQQAIETLKDAKAKADAHSWQVQSLRRLLLSMVLLLTHELYSAFRLIVLENQKL